MMYLKIHESYRKVVALCDVDLLGKRFEEGKKQLEIKEHFFKGEEISHSEAVARLRDLKIDDATFNIVGEKSVRAAIDAEIVAEENVSEVGGMPLVLVLV